MSAGQYVNTMDASILKEMARGYLLTREFNRTSLLNQPKRTWLIKKLLGSVDGDPYLIQSPLYVEYGKNIHVGKNFLANYNLVIQDGAPVNIGNDVLIAANVTITTIRHSFDPQERRVQWIPQTFPRKHKGLYIFAKPITIGNNVWICANTTICGGVTIGDNSVIGAGSVVTRNIPQKRFACGAPCRVIREIDDTDRKNQLYLQAIPQKENN